MIKFLLDNGADVTISRTVKKIEGDKNPEKIEQETFLTRKHPSDIIKFLKSIQLIEN
jgi:hypothetical protein